jgi:hypothetical protein
MSTADVDRAQEWAETDLPAIQAADLIAQACRERDPYFNDRPWPRAEDHADGRNPYARKFPDAPWVERHLPVESVRLGVPRVFLRHQRTAHDFPTPDLPDKVRCRRLVSFDRPEQDRASAS